MARPLSHVEPGSANAVCAEPDALPKWARAMWHAQEPLRVKCPSLEHYDWAAPFSNTRENAAAVVDALLEVL